MGMAGIEPAHARALTRDPTLSENEILETSVSHRLTIP